MSDLNAALIAFAGVLAGGYANNFVGEDYKRFRESQALAAALAGELESHGEAVPRLLDGLERMGDKVLAGGDLDLPEWPMPASPMFDQNAAKIGLLGPALAKEVAYVYEHLRAFRLNFHQLSKHHTAMPPDWRSANIAGCLAILTRVTPRGNQLIVDLKAYADLHYRDRPETRVQLKYGAWILFGFFAVLWLFTR
jgi:hypothetical protein